MRNRYLRNLGLLIALAVTAAPAVWAQAPAQAPPSSPTFARIQSRKYPFKEAALDMEYELYVPSRYKKSKKTPLIIALHGLGSNPRQVIRYQGLTELAEERGYIVAAPMGYNSRGWYGSRGNGRAGLGGGANDPENLGELSEMDVMNVLGLVRKEFNVDSKRIYLFGHSMGGGGTWHLGIKYPDLWAALAPAAPAMYSSPDALQAIKRVPVIVVQGDADRLVRVAVTRQWVEKMKALGMKYSYIEIPGGDHSAVINRSPENMRKIFDFFDKARLK